MIIFGFVSILCGLALAHYSYNKETVHLNNGELIAGLSIYAGIVALFTGIVIYFVEIHWG